jgi:hypothetical protein
MTKKEDDSNIPEDLKWHRKMAAQLFNHTWDLIDKGDKRTPEEIDEMIHSAHASRYHWIVVINSGKYPETGPVNHARGDWQLSRVYSLLKMPHEALFYAEKSLNMCLDNKIGDFDLAFGYEAMARAFSFQPEKKKELEKYLALAKEAGEKIEKKDDKDYVLGELNTIKA